MFTVYSTSPYPVHVPDVLYGASKRSLFDEETYLKTAVEQLVRERYLEEQRTLAAWRAQQETIRQQEYHRRQLNALRNRVNRRGLGQSYVLAPSGYIPVTTRASSPSPSERDILTSLLGYDVNYETEYEALRRRRAEQARSEYLRRLEQERNEKEEQARIKHAQQLANIERIQKALRATSLDYKGYGDKVAPVGEIPVKARKVDDSDRIRKAAIHNARVQLMERLQALASEVNNPKYFKNIPLSEVAQFNMEVADPSITTRKASEPAPLSPFKPSEIVTPPFPAASPSVNLSDGPKQNTEGANLRRRREIAARTIQSHWRSHSAEVAATKDALRTIDTLRSRFKFIQSSFIPPEDLQFREDAGEPILLFSSVNSAVNAYTHELDKLLSLADGVPSAGNEEVRSVRKVFVKLVEEALEKVDTLIRDIWNRQKLVSSEIISIPISDSENAPIESTVSATPPLDSANASINVISLTAVPAETTDGEANDTTALQNNPTLDQDSAAIPASQSETVNLAKVLEGDSATGSPVLVNISPSPSLSPNAPIPYSEAIRLAEGDAIAFSPSEVQISQHPNPSDDLEIHSAAATVMPEVASPSSEHDVSFSIKEDNDVLTHDTEPYDATEAQTVDVPVSSVFNSSDPDVILVTGNTKMEPKEDADIDALKAIQGNDTFRPACDLGFQAAISEGYPQANVHADTSLGFGDSFDTPSERKQPSSASNPKTNAGEDRGVVHGSTFSDNERKVNPEATGMLSEGLESDSKSALDAVQSPTAESTSSLPPYVGDNVDITHGNEDRTSSNLPFISPTSNTDDNFDIVYPDSPSTQSTDDLPGVQGETPLRAEGLEAKSGTDSDEFELL